MEKFRRSLLVYSTAFLALTLLSACVGGRSSGPAPEQGLIPPQKLQAAFYQLPMSFIPNQGQVNKRVRFYVKSGSASFFFARDEVVYSFARKEEHVSLRRASRSIPGKDVGHHREGKGRGHVTRIRFVEANPDPVIEGREELPGKVNYFIGRDPDRWKKGLPTYREVHYRELWPGIDLVYRGQGGKLKYEFVVKPGANPRQILLAYQGIEGLSISDSEDLILKTTSGDLQDSRPVAYQEIEGRLVKVEASFRVGTAHSAFVHGFEVRGYDPAYPLILDPGLEYATFLGGSNDDRGWGITLDAAGNAYVTGGTSSSDFPTAVGVFDPSLNGGDAFVAKFSSDGATLLYTTFLGGVLVTEVVGSL